VGGGNAIIFAPTLQVSDKIYEARHKNGPMCKRKSAYSFSVKIVWRSDSTRTPGGASLRLPSWIYWGRKGRERREEKDKDREEEIGGEKVRQVRKKESRNREGKEERGKVDGRREKGGEIAPPPIQIVKSEPKIPV